MFSIAIEKIEANPQGSLPSLKIQFKVTNTFQRGVRLLPIRYDMYYLLRFSEQGYLGSGVTLDSSQLDPGGNKMIISNFELGFSKASILETWMKSESESDLRLSFNVAVEYIEYVSSSAEGEKIFIRPFSQQNLSFTVARSTFFNWLKLWGRQARVIYVSGDLAKELDHLKSEAGALDYEDLIGTLVDRYRKQPAKVDELFLHTLPEDKKLRTKIAEILDRPENVHEVLITGWIDGVMLDRLNQLFQKGVEVRIIGRHSDEKGVTDAMTRLQRGGAKIKMNNMMHARLIIIDDKEVIVSSADLKSDSLDINREAGIHSTNPTTIREARKFFENVWNESRFVTA
mgnify:CR=1 FL=1